MKDKQKYVRIGEIRLYSDEEEGRVGVAFEKKPILALDDAQISAVIDGALYCMEVFEEEWTQRGRDVFTMPKAAEEE